MNYSSTSDGQTVNASASYATVYESSTTYKVNVTYIGGGQNVTSTMWILKNGTVLALDQSGDNFSSSVSNALILDYFAGFTVEAEASSQLSLYTSSSFFHSNGTSSATIGSTSFTVTKYAANSLPETITPCGGASATLTAYTLSVGKPTGSSVPLVTLMQLSETQGSGDQAESIGYSIQLTSVTVASQ